jgi:hypothetical protein
MKELFLRTGIGKQLHSLWLQGKNRRLHVQELHQAIEEVVQVADPLIRTTDRYQKALQGPIDEAMNYFAQFIDRIPGPVSLSRQGYEEDHRVQYLFSSPDELDEVLRISPSLQALRKEGSSGEVLALMTMTRREHTVYGYEQSGESVLRDVAQQAVDFIDHRIVAPAAARDMVKRQLVRRGLNILATTAMETISGLKAEKAQLREQREYLGAMLRIMGGRKNAWEAFAPLDPAQIEEIALAEQRLAEVKSELAELLKQLEGPEDALAFLKTVLDRPHEELRLEDYTLRMNWKRIRLDHKDDAEGKEMPLAEISNRNGNLKRSAVLVTIIL